MRRPLGLLTRSEAAPVHPEALEAACSEFAALLAQRTELDRRIAELSQTVGTHVRLCGYPGPGKPAYQAVVTRTVVLSRETAKELFGDRRKTKKGTPRS